ncbi:uncharacterized protein LOC141850219 isoform X2 [Brevipalpus obovatus]|uniref:uncharacterized protein LOC141850219 isoform X2 n=1 Tax=Brevipalpus obovatus TaxID=246614 RepID=UPI003D9F6CA8
MNMWPLNFFWFICFSFISIHSVHGNRPRKEDILFENICIKLFRGSRDKSLKSLPMLKSLDREKSFRNAGLHSYGKKILINRDNIVGQEGQLTHISQLGTDQSKNSMLGATILQQNNHLLDSEAKYFLLNSVLSANADLRKKFEDHRSSQDISLRALKHEELIDSLASKCSRFLDSRRRNRLVSSDEISELSNLYSLRSSRKNERAKADHFSDLNQSPEGTEIVTDTVIGPDGDFNDIVSGTTGSSELSSGAIVARLEQNHNKLERSIGDLSKITPVVFLNSK